MRFPMTPEGRVDRDLTIPMLRKAIELGINYFDTAIFYCNNDSQRTLGEAMRGQRDRVVLSTKNNFHEAPADAWWARLEESLTLLQTGVIDLYNLHGMSWDTWVRHIDVPGGKLALLQKAKDQGLIRHIACSFHDNAEALVKLGETGVFESITLQYNLLDRSLHDAIYRLKELNIGVVVMGPVGGGRLGVDSERIRKITGNQVRSTPEAALRFVLAHPGVSVALSGMSSLDMLQQNVRIVAETKPFTAVEITRIDEEAQRVREKKGVPCTACGYCMPCPFGVNIPGNFGIYNDYLIYGLTENARRAYSGLEGKAVRCSECGACLSKCPQKIEIPSHLRGVTRELDAQFQGFGAVLSLLEIGDNTLRARVTAKNLTDKPMSITVSGDFAAGVVSETAALPFDSLKSGEAASKSINIRIPDGVGMLEGDLAVAAGEERRSAHIRIPFFMIPRNRMRWHEARITAADLSGRQDLADTHGYRVGLRHDGEKVCVTLDIRSQLHALAAPGEPGGGRMELYVDMRTPEQGFGQAPYGDGVEQFFVSLGVAGYGAQSRKIYHLNQTNEKTSGGVRVMLELPLAEFVKPEWSNPRKIGLDFMFFVCDEKGLEMGHPTYGGRQGLYRDPGAFTQAILL